MLEEFNTHKDKFSYTKLTEEEIASRGILGRLVGPIADTKNPTRNGRKYNKQLWENVFNDPIMQEKIKNRCLFLELGHPTDRTETDMEKVCGCMAEQPKVGDDGLLYGVVDILPTANGKILKALCDYGTTVGISSRGTGDVIEDEDGNEAVDPDTYDCETFDIVLIPAVESARLQYVTEGLDKNKLGLKRALSESLSNATEEERKVMNETLESLNIKVDGNDGAATASKIVEEVRNCKGPGEEESVPEKGGDISAESEESEKGAEKSEEAADGGSDEIIKSLQETLKEKSELEASVQSLQEQLAVANDKVNKVNEELGRCKASLAELNEKVDEKGGTERISALEEELKAKDKTIEGLKSRIGSLVESKKSDAEGAKSLNESISKKDLEIKTLNENFDEIKSDYEGRIKKLTEDIEAVKSDSESKDKEHCDALEKERKIRENYKRIANTVVNRYIESKATALGVKADEIKNKLPESYTIDDIDSICEELQSYALNISKLPFNVDRQVKVKVRESVNEPLNPGKRIADDDIDESLYRLAGLDK